MAVLSVLGVTIGGHQYKEEFLDMVAQSLRVNREDPTCLYIDAWQHPAQPDDYMIVSVWRTEGDLLNWYQSPFHVELRNRGMKGLLNGYFNYQGELDEAKTHRWQRPL